MPFKTLLVQSAPAEANSIAPPTSPFSKTWPWGQRQHDERDGKARGCKRRTRYPLFPVISACVPPLALRGRHAVRRIPLHVADGGDAP